MSCQRLDALLSSRTAIVLGSPSSLLERTLLGRLRQSASALQEVFSPSALLQRCQGPEPGRLALVFDPALLDLAGVEALAASECTGVVWTANVPVPPALLRAARPHSLRFLGPRTAGFLKGGGINVGAFPVEVDKGGLALITQSGSIAAAAIDWATGREIGFSWAVTTGAEDDADLADFLDYAALDAQTRAVVLQVGRLQGARKFMSAARACARVKPVVVLQSRAGGRDPVRSAAFARSGLVECETLDGLFDALAAVSRVPARPYARVLTIGNGAGICALGVDAVLRYGLTPGDPGTLEPIQKLVPRARRMSGALDLGALDAETLVKVCKLLLELETIDYLLVVHSPSQDAAHDASVDALLAARLGPRVVTVWLGLESAASARRRSVEGGLSTFVTAGQAARALRYRWLHGRTRELLMQTPPPHPHEAFQRVSAQALIDHALQKGRSELEPTDVEVLLDHYALPARSEPATPLRFEIELNRHRELGMFLTMATASSLLRSVAAFGFPPMDTLLARRMIESMAVALPDPIQDELIDTLLSLSQLALDLPHVARLRLSLGGEGGRLPGARVELDPAPPEPRRRCALPPYPEQYIHALELRAGRRYRVRPILPEDEPALVAFLQSLRANDVRLRFFATIGHFSHEMAARMTQIDYDREFVLVAMPEHQPEQICAIAQLVSDPYGEAGEYAVLVHHTHAGAGLGRRLMQELLDHGRTVGMKQVYGEVLRDNAPMLALTRSLGFRTQVSPDDPEIRHVVIDL
jgi:GNAT superfamily N-acetyltransferase